MISTGLPDSHPRLTVLILAATFHLLCLSEAGGQTIPDSARVELPPLRVEASRGSFGQQDAPAAVSILSVSELRRKGEPLLALEALLTEMPGIWVSDRNHLALGERLVVRGLGSRAAFGVRSVAVLLDGVLLTMPDGQAVLDPIEPAMIRRAELIRGPASRFWGNASGGVLALESGLSARTRSGGGIRYTAGTLGESQFLAQANLSGTNHRTDVWLSRLDQDGFREHAQGRMDRVGLRSRVPLRRAVVQVGAHYSRLDTEAPGSLTLEQWTANPEAADARYIDTESGKVAEQAQVSVGATLPLAAGVLAGSVFGVLRSLDNPLPFGWVGVERMASGARLDWHLEQSQFRLGLAADARLQADDRINANNAQGRRGSNTTVDQTETVSGVGGSALLDVSVGLRTRVSAGLRVDHLGVQLEDRFVADDDQSGSRRFLALSPSLGLSREFGTTSAFLSYSSAFEIPTTTELVNSPDGAAGFNAGLEPQRISGWEAGLRAPGERVSIDAAAYVQRLSNFLSPYQLDTYPGRTFYTNVGRVDYLGLELAIRLHPTPTLLVEAVANLHRYGFASGDLKDKTVPGVPMRFGSIRIAREESGFLPSLRLRWASSQWADDDNTTTVDGFVVADFRLSHEGFSVSKADAVPFVEITNLTDVDYASSVVVNARGGRYYDGNPGRALRAGISVGF